MARGRAVGPATLALTICLLWAGVVHGARLQPQWWVVREFRPAREIALRAGPSPAEQVVRQLPAGEIVRELGCLEAGGETWCRVRLRDDREVRGWLARWTVRDATKDDLQRRRSPNTKPETVSPTAPSAAPTAPALSTLPYDARGDLPCSSPRDDVAERCAFLLLHDDTGTTLLLASPAAANARHLRVLRYEDGAFASRDGRFTYAAPDPDPDRSAWRVSVGNRDHYLIDGQLLRRSPSRSVLADDERMRERTEGMD